MSVRRGDQVRFVDSNNEEFYALVRTVGPVEDDQPISLVRLIPNSPTDAGAITVESNITSWMKAGGPPYWAKGW